MPLIFGKQCIGEEKTIVRCARKMPNLRQELAGKSTYIDETLHLSNFSFLTSGLEKWLTSIPVLLIEQK
jgi:hypothetical protein